MLAAQMDQDTFQGTNIRAVAMWGSWAKQADDSGGKVGKKLLDVKLIQIMSFEYHANKFKLSFKQ